MDSAIKKRILEADKNARMRDIESRIDMDMLRRELGKVEEHGYKVIQLPDKNRAQFAQVIAPNMRYLVKHNYLATSELAFLFSISGYIEMHSNAIVSYDNNEQGQYLKVSDISKLLNYSERQASRLINSLINKGVIYEYVDTLTIRKYGRAIQERPLFLNPEVIFCGDRNRVNATLCRLVMNADHLEKSKVRLPWKLWLDKGCEYGRLYRRDTWLKKKDTAKKKKD